jgi:hypothetical protein
LYLCGFALYDIGIHLVYEAAEIIQHHFLVCLRSAFDASLRLFAIIFDFFLFPTSVVTKRKEKGEEKRGEKRFYFWIISISVRGSRAISEPKLRDVGTKCCSDTSRYVFASITIWNATLFNFIALSNSISYYIQKNNCRNERKKKGEKSNVITSRKRYLIKIKSTRSARFGK